MNTKFKDGFIWGTATSSYQIEGAAYQDGKGESVWDVFCQQPGRVLFGQTGEVACDHYHRYEEDFAIMEKLGIKHYRFSFSWPRLIPNGIGKVNQAGVDFYNRMLDSMIAHGITPYATLFHWDYPYALFCKGAWLNEDSSDWFAEYTKVIAENFGDRIKYYYTLNEPQCFIGISYFSEIKHAPGILFPNRDCLTMAHNVMLGHGKAVKVLRELVPSAIIGYAPTGRYYHPATEKPEDIEAARKASFDFHKNDWDFSTSWWSDPIILGKYPDNAEAVMGDLMPKIKAGDLETINQPLDMLAQNIYQSTPVVADGDGYKVVPLPDGFTKTAFDWPVTPECLYWPNKFIYERYHLPIYISENGLSSTDAVSLDGKVHDAARIDYLQKHLLQLARAVENGVDIRGYFHWSFLDNFEWNSGYFERFGLVFVDFGGDLKRTIKDSAYYYKKVIETNGASLEDQWGII